MGRTSSSEEERRRRLTAIKEIPNPKEKTKT